MRSARSIESCATSVRELGHRPLRAASRCRPAARSPDLGRFGLGPRDQIAPHLLGRLARLLDDATGLVAGVGDLREVLRLLRLGLGARLLGALEVVADAVLARLLHVLHGRHAELPHDDEQHQERERCPR